MATAAHCTVVDDETCGKLVDDERKYTLLEASEVQIRAGDGNERRVAAIFRDSRWPHGGKWFMASHDFAILEVSLPSECTFAENDTCEETRGVRRHIVRSGTCEGIAFSWEQATPYKASQLNAKLLHARRERVKLRHERRDLKP